MMYAPEIRIWRSSILGRIAPTPRTKIGRDAVPVPVTANQLEPGE
jgi:hypothetical protein